MSHNVVQVEEGGKPVVTISLDKPPQDVRLPWLPVGNGEAGRLLLSRHPALFPSSEVGDIMTEMPDPAAHAAMIASALDLIRKVDPCLGEQIATRIKWYVPLATFVPGAHRSRTSANLQWSHVSFQESRQSFRSSKPSCMNIITAFCTHGWNWTSC